MKKFITSPVTAPLALTFSIVVALALQHLLGWLPCPLCVLQRLTSLALLIPLLARLGLTPGSSKDNVALAVCALFALAGAGASVAHLWVLGHPSDEACSPGLARMAMHLVDAIPGSEWLLEGSGACEDARYKLFGLPLPAWSLLSQTGSFALALLSRRSFTASSSPQN